MSLEPPRRSGSHPAHRDGLVLVIVLIAFLAFVIGFALGHA
jgi:hypothetical protein